MKKYFLNDGTGQQGPFDLAELGTKNISPSTPVWYEGLPEWTTAGQLEELKDLFPSTAPGSTVAGATPPPADEVTIPAISADPLVIHDVTPVPVTASPATASATIAAAAASSKATTGSAKKGSTAIAWISTVLLLGGVGYFIYQGMEKSNGTAPAIVDNIDTTKTTVAPLDNNGNNNVTAPDTASITIMDTATTSVSNEPAGTDPVNNEVPNTTTVANKTGTTTTTQQTAAQQAAAKKAEEEKKKQAALKKAAEDKKKADAAKAALLARQLEMRQHWSKYITFGNLNYDTKGDGIKAFDVPVYNGTDQTLDKVTVRIEYLKKNDKKIVKTENITIYNVPPRGGLNGKAPESKKGEKVNVYFTSITSSGLHFCYPQNNGSSDPYFCN